MRVFAKYHRDAIADIIFLCPSIDRDYKKDFGPTLPHPLVHLEKVTPEPHNLIIVENSGPEFTFAGTVNASIPHTRNTPLVVVYSDDVYPEEGWLTGMVEAFATDPKLGICGAVQYTRGGNVMTHIGGRLDEVAVRAHQLPKDGTDPAEKHLALKWCVGLSDEEIPKTDKIIYSDWVNGAIMGVPRKVWDELGGLDERFRFFWDDVDICWRAGRKGYGVGVHYDVLCVHLGGVTVRTMNFSQEESRKLMMDKLADMREVEQ